MALFLTGCLATVLVSPFFGVLLYVIQYLVNPPGQWWYQGLPDLRYSFIIMALVVVTYVDKMAKFRHRHFLAVPQGRWLAALTAVMLLTYVWAINPQMHLSFTLRYLKVLVFVVIAFKVTDTVGKLEALLAAYLAGNGYISFLLWRTGRTDNGRVEGIGCADTNDANGTAALVATAIPLLLFYALFGKEKSIRLASAVGLAFALNSLILLNSRGAFLALSVSCAYFCLCVFREPGLRGQKSKIVAGLVAGVCLFLYLADDVFWSRMSSIKDPGAQESVSRVEFWKVTPQMLADHPLGGGALTYNLLSPIYLPKEWLSGGARAVHSTWFEVLSEYGYHGLGIFICYVLSVFAAARRLRSWLRAKGETYHLFLATALESSWLSLLVASTFINMFYGELTYWLPMFVGAFCAHLPAKEVEEGATRARS